MCCHTASCSCTWFKKNKTKRISNCFWKNVFVFSFLSSATWKWPLWNLSCLFWCEPLFLNKILLVAFFSPLLKVIFFIYLGAVAQACHAHVWKWGDMSGKSILSYHVGLMVRFGIRHPFAEPFSSCSSPSSPFSSVLILRVASNPMLVSLNFWSSCLHLLC